MNSQQMQGVYAEARERQTWLTRSFFEASYEELVDRARRGQVARRNFAQEESSADHYVDFLDSLFFYYRGRA